MSKIKVKFHDRDPGFWEKEIEPTLGAMSRLLECDVAQMRIRIHSSGTLEVMAPNGHGLLIGHEDFKKVL